MTSDLPPPVYDRRHLDPEVRKERVKLAANGLNALSLALLIGAIVAPIVDETRHANLAREAVGVALGLVGIVAALFVLRYMKSKETA